MDFFLLAMIVVIAGLIAAWLAQPKCPVCGNRMARNSAECPKGHPQN